MILRPFFVALQFLTRIPNPFLQKITDREIGQSLLYYPIIGLFIGTLLFITAILCDSANTSSGFAAALALALWALVTGGLHLDGLADSADAWLGGYGDRERTLEIMKDPCSGPAATILVTLVLIIKFASLETLINLKQWSIIVLTPVLGRTMLVILFLTTTYVRKAGLGAILATHLPYTPMWIVTVAIMLVLIIITGHIGSMLIATAIFTLLTLRILMIKRIGGTTGDTAGATTELTETVVLMVAVFLI